MSIVIGLTGSIGTGKSTVSTMLKEMNIPVVDADVIAREVVQPCREAYKRIIATFGESILQADQSLDRKALGNIIFQNEEKRKQLNAIVHPAIRKEMIAKRDHFIQEGYTCVVLDIPLLYESNLTHLVDKVIVVAVRPEVQLERIMERDGSSKKDALSRIHSQIPITEKVNLADAVIDNNGMIEHSKQQLVEILKKWGLKNS